MTDSLNADFTRPARADTAAMDWQASPSPTVWRKRLDLVDGEFSRVTSVVRYDPDSAFHAHGHPQCALGEDTQRHRQSGTVAPAAGAATCFAGAVSAVNLSPSTRSTEASVRASRTGLAPLTRPSTSLAFAAPDFP